MYKFRNHIASFLLLLFIAAQLSVVHEFTHDDSGDGCDICLVVQNFNSQSFDLAPDQDVPSRTDLIQKQEIVTGLAFAKAESQPTIYTTRPPPVTL